MLALKCLFILIITCGEVFSNTEERTGFDQSLGTESIFEDVKSGKISLSSNPVATAMLEVDKNLYPQFFDTIVSSSIDSIQREVAPKVNIFAAENFGFNPIASQGFTHQSLRREESDLTPQPLDLLRNARPLKYNIRTFHDPNYRVFKPEEQEDGTEILSALKKNPAVSAYFQPLVNAQVTHPLHYRREESVESLESDSNYKPNPYIAGPVRIRRYTRGRSRENEKNRDDDDDDASYDYSSEYEAMPKAFKGSRYSAYKEDKDSKDKYDYPYKYDSGYDHKEYDRIKELSEKQAAEIKENPGNCKEVKRDGMTCNVCKDPKTGGNYESCSYQAEPKNNKYAYSKEKNFDSNDEPDDKSAEENDKPAKIKNYEDSPEDKTGPQKFTDSEEKPSNNYKRGDDDDKYKSYYIHTSNPKPSEVLRASSEENDDDRTKSKGYDYQKALPGFYSDNEPKKDVEHVLAEFKKKDRSACNKVQKNGMTCFQCLDKAGLKHEECMFVSESAPKQSHLAYQEVKEFTSKPATLEQGNEGSESQTITTSTPPLQKSAISKQLNKQKRKKATHASLASSASNPVAATAPKQRSAKVKRSENSEVNEENPVADEPNIAPPEEFAGADSKGAFWAETDPRYSADLGVSLPEYMLPRSEHEASFDELVVGA
ncbi:uncharacterized protein LOC110992771 isoform X1 [Pieris rapae]|uniref:uncharacterized protein LOC110992771 isoform X1 n=1 Tax=Pieris rapae TaxID=64459 RepID=UPI001E280E51|nr:uncharacterized protein LOC110992771 isoform X1 [Pieris rapae]